MKKLFLFITCILYGHLIWSQEPVLKVKLSQDTLSYESHLVVEFILENAKGQIVTPEFFGLTAVSGPMQTSSVQIVNGEMSQSMSLKYVLRADEPGTYVIESAHVEVDGRYLETKPIPVYFSTLSAKELPPPASTKNDLMNLDWWPRNKDPKLLQKPKKPEKKKYPTRKF